MDTNVDENSPPNLSMHCTEDEVCSKDQQFQLEMAKLRIKELEMKLELQRMSQSFLKDSTDKHESSPQQSVTDSTLITQLERRVDLPKREIQRFDGNPKKYWAFIRAFESTIETHTKDDATRLSYLIQFCDGPARSQIDHCTVLEPTEGYRLARDILHRRFGQNYMVAQAFVEDLLKGPSINDGDADGLTNLSQQLMVCDVTLRQMNYTSDLNSRITIQTIIKRLPSRLRFKWAKEVALIRKKGREPEISDVTAFVNTRVEGLCSDYGELALTQAAEERVKRRNIPRNENHPIKRYVNTNLTMPSANHYQVQCAICNGCHFADQCSKFIEAPLVERTEMVTQRKLCRMCLKANHIAKDCRSTRVCRMERCGRRHHYLLHPDEMEQTDEKENVSANHSLSMDVYDTSKCTKAVALAVTPVEILGEHCVIDTCAFLDSGSDSSFITQKLADQLQLTGKHVQLSLKTLSGDSLLCSTQVSVDIRSLETGELIQVPSILVVSKLPKLSRCVPSRNQLSQWSHLRDVKFTECKNEDIGLLLGCDVPGVHWVIEQKTGRPNEPYAIRTKLGWTLLGPLCSISNQNIHTNYVHMDILERELERFYQMDLIDVGHHRDKEMSEDDRTALNMMEGSIKLNNMHYEVALPWRTDPCNLPNNRILAEQRLHQLKKRLLRSDALRERYWMVMSDYINQGHAEPTNNPAPSWNWFLAHHPVFNPMKPDKLRIVFDCAAKFNGKSLNNCLFSGPDLTNSLTGVLLRFRRGRIAVAADIQAMFHQVRVPERDRDALRFLWWTDPELNTPPVEFRMCVHLFGATSSPSCAALALRKTITDNQHHFDPDIVEEAHRCFYVDDCLYSADDLSDVTRFVTQMKLMLTKGGFNLTKFVSNDGTMLHSLPETEHEVKAVEFAEHGSPSHRALGINWNLTDDTYYFQVNPMDTTITRRNILSYVSTFYDPMGYLAPVLLVAKSLLQRLCRLKYNWDRQVDGVELELWNDWYRCFKLVENYPIPRCIRTHEFGNDTAFHLHLFSDASETGYGVVAYALLINNANLRSCQLLMSKSRVAPIRTSTIPRLELAAAVLAVKLAKQIVSEMGVIWSTTTFWSDSTIVLYSINNTTKRFPTYFANRLAVIHELTDGAEWRYVSSKENPADMVSRGICAKNSKRMKRWIAGPVFLVLDHNQWPTNPHLNEVEDITCNSATVSRSAHGDFLQHFLNIASWSQLQRHVAWLLRYQSHLLKRQLPISRSLTCLELQQASTTIFKMVQSSTFHKELSVLNSNNHNPNACVKMFRRSSCSLYKLNPIMIDGILRVGGRLQRSDLPFETKHPIILPSSHFVTRLLILHYHTINGHMGLTYVLAAIRKRYWITAAVKTIRSTLSSCFKCRRWFGSPCQQAMAPLIKDQQLMYENPFTATGVDYFGPLYVKRGRTTEKRYGCLFVCLSTRAIHIEVSHTMDTDSFLCAFNRFVVRRGCPKRLYSDNGTNFKGAELEVKRLLKLWNQDRIASVLASNECEWNFNPPWASHRGGLWERIIRSVKRILLITFEEQLMTDEVLHTTLLEIERILNDRPLVKQTTDPEDQHALSPGMLLLLRRNSTPDVIEGSNENRFTRRWRQAQHMANAFWRKWIKTYLPSLQTRQRWFTIERNIQVGELVLLMDVNAPRGRWPKAVVQEVHESEDGLVREAVLRTSTGLVRRDIRQICRLEGTQLLLDESKMKN